MATSAFLASSGWVSMTCAPDAGLHGDHAHRVGHDVVQLLGDPQALLGQHPRSRLGLLLLEELGALLGRGQPLAARPDGLAQRPTRCRRRRCCRRTSPAVNAVCSRVTHRTTMAAARIEPASARLRRRP